MPSRSKDYTLTSAAVDEIADDIQSFLVENKTARRDALRARLTMEEVLLRILEQSPEGLPLKLTLTKFLGRVNITLRYGGPPLDPTVPEDDDKGWSGRILKNLGLSPVWSWSRGRNQVQLRSPKAENGSSIINLLIAVVAAVVIGSVSGAVPTALRTGLDQILLLPFFNAYLGLINTVACLLILTAVASGVSGIGDTGALGRVSRVMFPRFLGKPFLIAAIALAVGIPVFRLTYSTSAGGISQLSAISEMIFNIVPRNLVEPFLTGNTLPIIFLAALLGVVLLLLGERVRTVAACIDEVGSVTQTMMEQICRLIPLFVFVSVLRQFWSGGLARMLELWKPFCMILAVCIVITVIKLVLVSLRTKASMLLILRKLLPPTFIAFTTASSLAAFSACNETCRKQMGIDASLLDFGFPIGMVTFMPASVVLFSLLPLSLAEIYGLSVDLPWFLMAGFLAAILSIAVPPTPGAGLTCYGIIFAQLGIPGEAMLLAVAMDVALDYFNTALNVLNLQLELTGQADILHILDRETLYQPIKGGKHP